jgi:hypothetical protein
MGRLSPEIGTAAGGASSGTIDQGPPSCDSVT